MQPASHFSPDRTPRPLPAARPWNRYDGVSLIGLSGIVVYFLSVSWRRWPDPLVDFGVQLYTAWRLSQGAVLYKDIHGFYGPLSPYFNGVIFSCFGPSLMALVWVNLIIFGGIIGLLYALARQAWGTMAAFVACAVFVAVFAFGQHVNCGNYNYVTPYTHETTHGIFVCLTLTFVVLRWIRGAPAAGLIASFLFGLTVILKPEIMFSAGLVLAASMILYPRIQNRISIRMWLGIALSAAAPTLIFTVYFACHLSFSDAWQSANYAWLSLFQPENLHNSLQENFIGLDQPWLHLKEHLGATLAALTIIVSFGSLARLCDRLKVRWARFTISTLAVTAVVAVSYFKIDWALVGRSLLGLLCTYGIVKVIFRIRNFETAPPTIEITRLLLFILASSLMARMALNGRIFQYGFYQAALAGTVISAIIVSELPEWLGWRKGRWVYVTGIIGLLLPGIGSLVRHSNGLLRSKTASIGQGADLFYAFPLEIDPAAEAVNEVVDFLHHQPSDDTLLVLPEGAMLNYLSRRINPSPSLYFYGPPAARGREAMAVEKLKLHPPTWVIFLRRDLREYGIDHFGQSPGNGGVVLPWVGENYQRFANLDAGDHRNSSGNVLILKHKE